MPSCVPFLAPLSRVLKPALIAVIVLFTVPIKAHANSETSAAFDQALALQTSGDTQAAISAYQALQKLDPDPATAHNLATLYLKNGAVGEAKAALLSALERSPSATQVATLLIKVLQQQATLAYAQAISKNINKQPVVSPSPLVVNPVMHQNDVYLPSAPRSVTKPSIYAPDIPSILRAYQYIDTNPAHPAATPAQLSQTALEDISDRYERSLLKAVMLQQEQKWQQALKQINEHLSSYPKSRVGYVVKADLMRHLLGSTFDLPASTSDFSLDGLREQLAQRITRFTTVTNQALDALIPSAVIDAGNHPYVLLADMQNARLYVYQNQNNTLTRVHDYYLTVGSKGYGKELEGDLRTPIGVYRITQFIADSALPDLYGSGAFPVDYPNVFDRAKQRTGYGIWLHGTPSSTFARAPWASEGCFVLSNPDFEHVARYLSVDNQTPVVLAESLTWLDPNVHQAQKEDFLTSFEAWRSSWEELDMDTFLEFYSKDQFDFGRGDYAAWAASKRGVNQSKEFVNVSVTLEGVFNYPGETDMMVVWFEQKYESNNYSNVSQKQQFWQRDINGAWRILYER